MDIKSYAGIGTRKCSPEMGELIKSISQKLDVIGYKLLSGGADGSDTYFSLGSQNKEIFRPENVTYEALQLSSKFHPVWKQLKDIAKALHGRNAQILLGKELNEPVKFVIVYTHEGKEEGGSAQGIRIAKHYNIPIFNLGLPNVKQWFENWILNFEDFDPYKLLMELSNYNVDLF